MTERRHLQGSAIAAAVALLAIAAAGNATGADAHNDPLSTTLLGRLEPNGDPRLAVRWDGPPGAVFDAWVDFDGNGDLSPHELVVAGWLLEPGIEVVKLEIPAEAYEAPEPGLWVRVREPGPAEHAVEACLSSANGQECAWQPGFTIADLDHTVHAFAVYDDGSGPALFVGGDFLTAGGVTVNRIAKWDGTAWSPLSGPSGTGTSSRVYALAVFDDGSGPALFAGGWFTTAGGLSVNRIAKWDGTAWSALSGPSGTGANNWVYALAVFDDGSGPALFAGGSFTQAGGVTVNYIAEWDGTAWSDVSGPSGIGMDGTVYALAVFDDGSGPALFAGGGFSTAGGVTVNNIARWDGSEWSPLSGPTSSGTSDQVDILTVFDDGSGPALFVGGSFITAGGVTVNYIAKWDGTAWSPLSGPSGTGTSSRVYALAVFDDGSGPALFAGGWFTTAGGVSVNHIARWNGNAWSALSHPSGAGMDSDVNALAVFDDGSGPALFAGGYFTTAGGVTANHIARWDGTVWSDLSGPSATGMDGSFPRVSSLAVYDDGSGPALFAGGSFTTAGGVTVNHIARWDGTAWSALSGPSGTGMDQYSFVDALAVFDDGSGSALFAGGHFTTAGGVTVNDIAKWDGTAWSALTGPSGTGMNNFVSALTVFDDGTGPALFAGGFFTHAGGVLVRRIAKWDGTEWSALFGPSDTGVNDWALALAVFDDGSGPALFAGGNFADAGGVTVNYIAKWDGSTWSPLSGPAGTGTSVGSVGALTAFDDGSGAALYAGGDFFTAGGVTVNSIARWDGAAWSALSGPSAIGVSDVVSALTAFDDGSGPALCAGGGFVTAGGLPSSRIAAWRCAGLFADGFESGDTAAWSITTP